ncbi:formate/nitrite transporter family protein [Clostridium lundense]|uniref:formate/nitrite transporter family protein n=1 Tax=Clostridium lundense TaxID=319475 RepID=UPI000485CDE6|nr:formate/nitrite transporter family protein [Clostridium lundense]
MEKGMLKPNELCDVGINAAIGKAKLTSTQVILLGILAGAFIALGGFSSTVASHAISNFSLSKFVAGAVFPVGLMLVIICGAELFTGNCLMITGVLDKKLKTNDMIKNWILVYFSNFLGAMLIVLLLYFSGSIGLNSGKLGGAVIKTAYAKCTLTASKAFCSGILCNIIVCLAVWGSYAAKDVVGKISIIWFPIMAFVVAGFEHSVANMYFLFIGLFSKTNSIFSKASMLSYEELSKINMSNILHNLTWVTLGNIVGGALFVGAAYWMVYRKNTTNNISYNKTVVNIKEG